MSFFLMPTPMAARRLFLGRSGLVLSAAAVALLAGKDALAAKAGGATFSALSLAALGVVFGDIGTSPLYSMRECFHGAHGMPITRASVLLAGRRVGALYRPLKRLPAHAWHAAHGALFEIFGDWSRPAAYPLAGEPLEAAAQREAAGVRAGAGLLDGSPLGKLEVFGPDAARFLDLMYVGTMSTLPSGARRLTLAVQSP